MKPLQPPESHHLSAASGWLGLGRHLEADQELQNIAPHNSAHPDVLEVRWQICAKAGNWAECRALAESMIKITPNRAGAWVHRAYSLHELQRTEEALDQLMPVAQRFPHVWTIPYALACFCAQLGRFIECQLWLRKAMGIDKEAVRRKAIGDPRLQPLWASMTGKAVIRNLSLDTSICVRITAPTATLATPECKRYP